MLNYTDPSDLNAGSCLAQWTVRKRSLDADWQMKFTLMVSVAGGRESATQNS